MPRRRASVKPSVYPELAKSLREMGEILRGERRPSRVFTFPHEDVRAIRDRTGRTQEEFALLIGVSVATLRNWEQGRRKPRGPARALLRVVAANPRAVVRALSR